MLITRRSMLSAASAGIASLSAAHLFGEEPAANPANSAIGPIYPTQDPDMARDIVGASHGNIARVRELLEAHPTLAKAAWDWGFGDWETALGAASHVGNREIAALLIKHGARPDLFTFAMLGQLDVVKAYIAANPGIQRIAGPHSITLLSHARAGGEQAAAVVKYLTELGDADINRESLPMSEESKKLYIGDYSFGSGHDARLLVKATRMGDLSIQRGEKGSARVILRNGEHAFYPVGAPAVKVVFEMKGSTVSAVRVTDGPLKLLATRL